MRLMKRVKCLSSFFESLVKEIDGVQHLLMMKRLEIANRSHRRYAAVYQKLSKRFEQSLNFVKISHARFALSLKHQQNKARQI